MRDNASPKWEGEKWIIRHIPFNAKLFVALFDKDIVGADDEIGQFEVLNLVNYHAPPDGHEVVTASGEHHGRFHLSIQATESTEESKKFPKYTFDGPCRYFRRDSAAAGQLTKLNDTGIYSTWTVSMRRISVFLLPLDRQFWDKGYSEAQKIFGDAPLTFAWRDIIKLAHKALYGKTLKTTASGRLNTTDDLWKFIFSDKNGKRVKPCLYTICD